MALLGHQYSLLVFPFQLHLPNHTCIGLALPRGAVKKKQQQQQQRNCGRQEEPAILISRLLLRMHRIYSYFQKGCRKKRARDNPER